MEPALHTCGGVVLCGGGGPEEYRYCSKCEAFRFGAGSEVLPGGTDKTLNRQAWDQGERASPGP